MMSLPGLEASVASCYHSKIQASREALHGHSAATLCQAAPGSPDPWEGQPPSRTPRGCRSTAVFLMSRVRVGV